MRLHISVKLEAERVLLVVVRMKKRLESVVGRFVFYGVMTDEIDVLK